MKKTKIILATILFVNMVANGLFDPVLASSNITSLNISNGIIEISEDGYRQSLTLDDTVPITPFIGEYEITGTSSESNSIKVIGGQHKVTINDLNISNTVATNVFCPMSISNNSNVELNLKGTNEFNVAFSTTDNTIHGLAGIEVSDGNSLTIIGEGRLSVQGGRASAGIGGSFKQASGNVKILGGDITAKSGGSTNSAVGGAGIGGGAHASGGSIYIGGDAKVHAIGYRGGSGIGASGTFSTPIITKQSITITDQAEVVAEAGLMQPGDNSMGAAIGGGYKFKGGSIEISGQAKVRAISATSGACLGGGDSAVYMDETSILIKDTANVTAYGAGAVTCFGNGQYSSTHGTMDIEGQPTIFAYTYGKSASSLNVEDKTIAATFANNSSSAVLKGYFNMTDCLAENGKDTYLEIITDDQQSYVVEYAGVNNQYFSDYVLITPSNGFIFKDDQQQAVDIANTGAKDVAKVSYMNNTTLLKETYSVKNYLAVKPEITTNLGQTVEGWYKESTLTNKWDFEVDKVISDMSLYVNLAEEEYNITYENLKEATTNNPATYTINSNITFNSPIGDVEHYTFAGWFDGLSDDAIRITGISAGSTGDMILYAKWEADNYTITYNGLEGTTHSNPLSYTIETPTITLANPTDREGYTFKGWFDGENREVTEITKGSTGNKILTAKWEENNTTVSIIEEKVMVLRVYKEGVNTVDSTNSSILTLKMQKAEMDIPTDFSLLQWEVENIAGFENYAPVVKIDEATGKVIGLKSGVAKVTVKLKVGYDSNDPSTYDTCIVIIPGDVDKDNSVSSRDSILIGRIAAKLDNIETLPENLSKEYIKELMDMDGDGVIGIKDVAKSKRMTAKLDGPSN